MIDLCVIVYNVCAVFNVGYCARLFPNNYIKYEVSKSFYG